MELELHDLPAVIGRSREADVRVRDHLMSRQHCVVGVSDSGRFELRDLESTNLTIVNGMDIDRHELQDGDEIFLGETSIRVQLTAPENDITDRTTRDLPVLPPDPDEF